jgi:hypothetical protein
VNSTIFKTYSGTSNEIFDGAGYEDLTRPGFVCYSHTHLSRGARDLTINGFTFALM